MIPAHAQRRWRSDLSAAKHSLPSRAALREPAAPTQSCPAASRRQQLAQAGLCPPARCCLRCRRYPSKENASLPFPGVAYDLHQDTAGTGRMHKEVVVPACACLHRIAGQPYALLLHLLKHCVQSLHMYGDVVESFSSLCQKPSDHRIRLGWLQQLNPALSQGEHRCPYLFVLHGFFLLHSEPQSLIKSARRGDAFDRDSEMVQPKPTSGKPRPPSLSP